jgi:hypothetical protein
VLTQAAKTAIRRHLGVPFAGTAQAGRLFGWRFTWYREDLEYRVNNLTPSEEQLISGVALASWQIAGRPTVGDTLTYTIQDAVVGALVANYAVQPSDLTPPVNQVNPSESSPLYAIALNSVPPLMAAAQAAGYAAMGVMPADLFSPAYLAPYFAEVLLLGPNANPFQIFAAVSAGATTNFRVETQGTPCPVRASLLDPATGIATPFYGYVAILDVLAMSMTAAQLSLTYSKADVVEFRRDEVRARRRLYREYILQLERCLGGQSYVEQFGGGVSAGATA